MKIAIISDVHGNSWALKAVLVDIYKRNITEIYDLGDSLYGPLDPQGTFELFIKNGIQSISGNEDRIILENLNKKTSNRTLEITINAINQDAIEWLKILPKTRRIDNRIFLCHGTPTNDSEYLIEQVNKDFVGIRESIVLEEMLARINEQIIICGHSHCPRIVETEGKLLVNPGSVGCPAYDDDIPIPHKIENHSSMARYCTIEMGKSIIVEHIAVSYDHQRAVNRAKEYGKFDWAKWLEYGKA
jgi:putative phosphoesterase